MLSVYRTVPNSLNQNLQVSTVQTDNVFEKQVVK